MPTTLEPPLPVSDPLAVAVAVTVKTIAIAVYDVALAVVAEAVALDGLHHLDETVHEDGEESDTEDLDDTSENLLHDRDWAEVTITDC